MAKLLRHKTLITIALAALLVCMGSGCSQQKPDASNQQDALNIPPPDAGTDAVPQAAVEDRSGNTDVPSPPATSGDATASAAGAPPTAEAPPTAPQPDASAQPQAPDVATAPVPAPAADNSSAPPPADQNTAQAPAPTVASADTPADTPDDTSATAPAPATADESGSYTVRTGDTLMKIAFDNYGDLYKWKDIYEANKDHIPNPNALPPGTVLKLEKSETPVVIARNGDQYLIKSGDTLGSIAKDVYGTPHKWKKLWENNKQLIKDPNKIYAGFALFYTLDSEERLGFEKSHGGQDTAAVADSTTPAANPTIARQPASVTPPAVAPPPPEMLNVPPPAAHSADLNDVIQKVKPQAAPSNDMAAVAGP